VPKADHGWLGVAAVMRLTGAGRSTVHDWLKKGIPPRGGGEPVRLHARRFGTRWKTRRRWLAEFQRAVDGLPPREPPDTGEADQAALASRLAGRKTG
jgi:predicted DNA-binding transcriptional regulator AlpA